MTDTPATASSPASSVAPPTAGFDAEAHVEHMSKALGLTIEPAWKPAIVAHVGALARAADLVFGLDLPDEIEAAPVYEA